MELREFITNKIRKYLNGASFYSFNNDDILSDKYIKNFIKSDDLTNILLDWFIEKNDLNEDDKEDIRLSSDFHDFIREELERHLEEAKESIYDKIDFHSNKITLYRAITVDDNWLQHLKTHGKRLGIYWSWEQKQFSQF